MDKTNRIIKICRRIDEIEYRISCTDLVQDEIEALLKEKQRLEIELESLHPAS